MSESVRPEEPAWEGGWDGHQRARRQRMAKLSLIDRLQWLEEAHRVARHLEASKRMRASQPQLGHGVMPDTD